MHSNVFELPVRQSHYEEAVISFHGVLNTQNLFFNEYDKVSLWRKSVAFTFSISMSDF